MSACARHVLRLLTECQLRPDGAHAYLEGMPLRCMTHLCRHVIDTGARKVALLKCMAACERVAQIGE